MGLGLGLGFWGFGVLGFWATTAVILVTHFYAGALPIQQSEPLWPQLFTFIAAGYTFKLVAAALDTLPFYLGVRYLVRYLRLPHPASKEALSTASKPEP